MMNMNANIIILEDTTFGEKPIWLAKFDNGFGTTPNRNDAFVCSDDEVEKYIEYAKDMEKKKMKIAGFKFDGRQVSSESVIVLEEKVGDLQIRHII